MKTYIGTKVVHAEPQKGFAKDGEEAPGYKVVYEDGYVSWSPREVFERCYREITIDEKDLVMSGDDHAG